MLTVSSWTFRCELRVASRVAFEAGLRQELGASKWDPYYMWVDTPTSGGGCRIVWKNGIAWISRHSGHPEADCTEEVAFFLELYGAIPLDEPPPEERNPYLYPSRLEPFYRRG